MSELAVAVRSEGPETLPDPAAPARPGEEPAGAGASGARPAEFTIVVPTYNERANVAPLVARLHACLLGTDWEVIFVDDDSPDGTAAEVRAVAARDPRVRCLQRIGRRGLSSACVEGMLASSAPYLAVIDADLQHDERLLPRLLDCLRRGEADIAVASRYLEQADAHGLSPRRQAISRLATRLGRLLLRVEVSDPMSGFFALRREAFEAAVGRLSGIGFKILLDLLASSPEPPRVRELPYRFGPRLAGESKLDNRAAQDFLLLLVDKLIGRWVPARFVLFALVGGLGVFVHLAVLLPLHRWLGVGFVASQTAATLVAMTFNYALNNELTYRDRRLRGRRWLWGWLTFSLACGLGAIANIGIAAQLFATHTPWLLAALVGILAGTVWNYAITSVYTWNAPRRAG